MKKVILTISIVALIFSSCDQLLDVEADNLVNSTQLETVDDFNSLLAGVYYNLGGVNGSELLGGDFIILPTLLGLRNDIIMDASQGYVEYEAFLDHNILTTNPRVEASWFRAYETINQANLIIENISKIESSSEADRILGEAYGIRGIIYFEMVRLWAPQYESSTLTNEAVPILTNAVTELDQIELPSRSTVQQVYTQAFDDLDRAQALLEPFGKNGTGLSYYGCLAYLSRLAFQQNDFINAALYSGTVINSSQYIMSSTPVAAFHNTSNSLEDIFAIQQTAANNSGDRAVGLGLVPIISSVQESGFGVVQINDFYINSASAANINRLQYASNDLRGTVQDNVSLNTTADQINQLFYELISTVDLEGAVISSGKYVSAEHVIPVVRLAEMHLTRAEAIYFQNESVIDPVALNDLNVVRERAGLSELEAINFVTPESFYDSIRLERKREFFMEGHLVHDLRRRRAYTGDPTVVIGFFNDPLDSDLILPVPQSETDISGLD